ncbi:MAG: hypothetical protein EOP90_00005 [Lysobacteraceae bacterium]|nr:MAG: hypothetical protein EOP90_00005 [Xanthomonadaceae bacterium]
MAADRYADAFLGKVAVSAASFGVATIAATAIHTAVGSAVENQVEQPANALQFVDDACGVLALAVARRLDGVHVGVKVGLGLETEPFHEALHVDVTLGKSWGQVALLERIRASFPSGAVSPATTPATT